MDDILNYVPIIFSAIAATVGIFGNTIDLKGKLRYRGKLLLVIIGLSSIYSLHLTYIQIQNQREKVADEARIGMLIETQVEESIQHLLEPFRWLYTEYATHEELLAIQGYPLGKGAISLTTLLKPENLSKAQGMCFDDKPTELVTVGESFNWKMIFSTSILRGLNGLDRVVNVYGMVLDSNLLTAIYKLQDEGHFSSMSVFWKKHTNQSTDIHGNVNCTGQAIGSHEQYLKLIGELRDALKESSGVYVR